MFWNHFLTAWRNLSQHRLYAFINIVGLSIGLACAISIVLFVHDEISYDRWIPGTRNLYRVEASFFIPGRGLAATAGVPFPVTQAMQAQIPEVKAQTRLVPEPMTVKVDGRLFNETVDVVDPNFFQLLQLPLMEGDPVRALSQPESVVLSQALAKKYFGHVDPLGKTIELGGAHPLVVTGVLRDLPHNTQLIADMVIPNTSQADQMFQAQKQAWLHMQGYGFVQLLAGADPSAVVGKVHQILDRNLDPRKLIGLDIPGSHALDIRLTHFVDDHLTTDKYGGLRPPGSWTTLYGFSAIAALILLIACFNFTNLATARATIRAREISLRKVMGARRSQLIAQFLGESVLMSLIAMVLAEVLMPAYGGIFGDPIALNALSDWPLMLTILAIAVLAGLMAGIYPAFLLSGFRAAATLRAHGARLSGSSLLRSMLVIAQFAVSIGLGIAVMVVFGQVRHARAVDLGFERDALLIVDGLDTLTPVAADDLAHMLAAEPSIDGAALSGAVPFVDEASLGDFKVPGSPQTLVVRWLDTAPEFPAVYGMKLLAGRLLERGRGADVSPAGDRDVLSPNVLVNTTAARRFGFTVESAVGRTVLSGPQRLTIVGVLSDPLINGPGAAAMPLIFQYNPTRIQRMSVRIRPGRTVEAVAAVDHEWRRFAPNIAIQRHFLNDYYEHLFAADLKQGAMFAIFVAVAIFIACLGLFGLAAFTAERRTREIGIRKVFGASTNEMVRRLLWEFTLPVLIANGVAWPVAGYFLHGWLEHYASHIDLSPIYFITAGLTALLIAWATVILHALRVARANPIHALRYE